MKISDLKRCYYQFEKHQKINYLQLNMLHKFFLGFSFFLLLPTVLLNLFLRKKNSDKVYVLEYTDQEPYASIYKRLRKDTSFYFVSMGKYFVPILPRVYINDVFSLFLQDPRFFFKNLDFLGALAIKISRYNWLIKKERISTLIVLQEYSFYITYVTRILEEKKGKLYNIQHGIPGDTYCFFRFSKCFVWGEYFKEEYIKNQAQGSQFIVSGSIFHDSIDIDKHKDSIDILYVMQGYVGSKRDTLTILDILEKISSDYTVRILQHPRHRIKVSNKLLEYEGAITKAIADSRVVISRYSTGLLDAQYFGKCSLAYIGEYKSLKRYLSYLTKEQIIETKEKLQETIIEELQLPKKYELNGSYINNKNNPIKVIKNECYKKNTL